MPSSRDRTRSLPLFDALGDGPADTAASADRAAREFAIDPRHDVVLEASAGTGKTSVLVGRYLALLDVGVDPANILAITFTRKAAAEMRDRILLELRRRAAQSADGARRWRQVRDRLGDVSISTIDAFCLALLGEFPLEANLDPGFGVADDTDVAVLLQDTIETTLRVSRGRVPEVEAERLLLAQLPQARLSRALAHLVDRRVVATETLARVLAAVPAGLTMDDAVARAARRVADAIAGAPGGVLALVNDRPATGAASDLLRADVEAVLRDSSPVQLRSALQSLRDHFVTQDGTPRSRPAKARKRDFASAESWSRHVTALQAAAPIVAEALAGLERDTNAILVRGLQRLHAVAVRVYRSGLEERDVVDFTEGLARTVALLENMDEFAQSRYRLQSRYHHVLVDEFQDTSRLQWRLVSLLVEAWGEGSGLVHEAPVPPTIFVVGDPKQSIYRFRDADVTILRDAAGFIAGLRPASRPRRTISRSFRARPALLAIVNDLCDALSRGSARHDAFRYEDEDRFPLDVPAPDALSEGLSDEPALGLAVAQTDAEVAEATAGEIARLLATASVRDRHTGLARPACPADIAILFRARESHRAFETALERRGIPTYVYKGLGFFESPEIQDLSALIRFLASPASPLQVAALLRSRFVRLSDAALAILADDLAAAVLDSAPPARVSSLDHEDREVLELLRSAVPAWLARVDRVPPAELVDDILRDTAYDFELRGARAAQAHENVKKLRMLVRRLQNRGYLTMARLSAHLSRLSAGDESNAIIDAADAVNLMTVHAAKGLEFPVVFLVNLGRGTGGGDAIRLMPDDGSGAPAVAIAGFRSDADERDQEAEREESKRLLYVALTRARDRLYLSATVAAGGFRPGRGSLGEVLPDDFKRLIGEAAQSAAGAPDTGGEISWRPPGEGRNFHRFLRVTIASRDSARALSGAAGVAPAVDRVTAVRPAPCASSGETIIVSATAWALQLAGVSAEPPQAGVEEGREVVGRLVHRLFQAGIPADAGTVAVREVAARLLRPGEDVVARVEEHVRDAAAVFELMRGRKDVVDALASGRALHEVPFSLVLESANGRAAPGAPTARVVVRGTIDCLVFRDPGPTIVLEFKTGRRAAWHEAQLAVYVEAVREAWPDRPVEGRLVYAFDGGQTDAVLQ